MLIFYCRTSRIPMMEGRFVPSWHVNSALPRAAIVFMSSYSLTQKTNCHCEGSDTPGIPTLNSLKTHMWTNIHSALSLSQIAPSIVTFNVSHIPKHAQTFHHTSKWQSSSPHSAHVSPSPPHPSVLPAPSSLPPHDWSGVSLQCLH